MFFKFQGIYTLLAFLGCLLIGTLGYRIIEGWSILDSLYMTVITITTVGFHEENPLSPTGKIFTIFLIFFGFGICVYTLSNVTSLIMRGEFIAWIRRYFMNAKVELFDDHYIVCGFGRMGKVVAKQLELKQIPFVIVESDPHNTPDLSEFIHPVIIGNAGDEEVLKKAAIDKARGLISVVSSDAENVFIVLTARRMNKKLHIVTRCLTSSNIPKLELAGADKVISPFDLGGNRIAQAALHPTTVEFVDLIENVADESIEIADLMIRKNSKLAGKKVIETELKSLGIIIVGIKKPDLSFQFNPQADTMIEEDDHLIVVGPSQAVAKTCDLLDRQNA